MSVYISCETDQWTLRKSLRTNLSHQEPFILQSTSETRETECKEFTAAEVAAVVLDTTKILTKITKHSYMKHMSIMLNTRAFKGKFKKIWQNYQNSFIPQFNSPGYEIPDERVVVQQC